MLNKPLISHLYTADPSAHVFEGKLYIYPSHDRETDQPTNDNGDQYDMVDYHVFSMDDLEGEVTDHGVALSVEDVAWADKQLWAPDAAYKDGKYYLYFPARDKGGIFRIGVAVSDRPEGPFSPEPEPMKGSFSIDPATFVDDDNQAYMYFGGIWGGQLQNWQGDEYNPAGSEPEGDVPAILPVVGKLTDDMKEFAEKPREIEIVDENGELLKASDHDRRFFEASWMHKYNGRYYFSYSTGDTHYICYATSDNPYGPFVYGGRILEPVLGWTTHHSIVEFQDRWFLFHHDCEISDGVNHLRNVKIKEIFYDSEGNILPVV
ncbi:glycoside hydrolase family 43 protein [Pelagicoccus albus]|uniref:Glycoside hydrolase family 43 protein n=1 Tax=Pelagicoccus albus TaxID=415222 RepID=A0A7X1B4J6_9BACT|nr:glycoside hydrolase family 43 protein [Pelagicoccus albus]MBC2605417.1 glycoside hydrolase family 43 protein [Pelagicoccus albus]